MSASAPVLNVRYATTVSAQIRDNLGAEIFGEVQNIEAKVLKSVKVVVTFYEVSGAFYDTAFSSATVNPILPGGTSPYLISTFDTSLIGRPFMIQAEESLTP